jgi:hypothetical protein
MSTLQTATILDKIRSRGYWRVVIRPTTFQERQIPRCADLFPIVEKSSVRLPNRPWEYPCIDSSRVQRGDDWVGQKFEHGPVIESWRIYLSGQFVHFFAMAEDWQDQSTCNPDRPGQVIEYHHAILSLREIYEFAARLALSPAGAGRMRVEVDLHGLKDRCLVTGPPQWMYYGSPAEASEWNHLWEGPQTELIASPRELAAQAAHGFFFETFGVDLSLEILQMAR